MIKALITSHDPVCGMNIKVAGSHIFTTYHGLTYHFCSSQCLERFNDTPALYTGPNVPPTSAQSRNGANYDW